jgi:integrase
LTPPIVTPYTVCMMNTKQQSTRQLLEKIPSVPCLYRHSLNDTYYGIKKLAGKRKEHSLQTADRKIAERKLADWIKSLGKLDSTTETMTLNQLLEKLVASRQGKSESTIATDASIIARFKEQWKHGLDIRVSRIKPSFLDEWLASNESRLKHASYNRYSGFLKTLFKIALDDRAIVESPFESVKTPWKKPQKPKRVVPTQEQFEAIVNEIRTQRFNAEAKDSADFVEFLGLAGLGQAEASALAWGDIDWTVGIMHIKRQKTQERFQVPIYDHLKPLLERMLKEYPAQPSPDTKVFKILDARKALAAACKRLGYHPFTQRNIRAALHRDQHLLAVHELLERYELESVVFPNVATVKDTI